MSYHTVLLDLDHTLVDFDGAELRAYDFVMRKHGLLSPMDHFDRYHKINADLWGAVERGEILPPAVGRKRFEIFLDELQLDVDVTQVSDDFLAALAHFSELYPGVREVLEELTTRASLAYITNGLSEVQRPRIERLELEQYVDAVVVSGEEGVTKPNPGIFDILFERLGHPTREGTMIVGDSLTSDIKGGANYGIDTCWYNPNGKVAGPDDSITYEIKSIRQLLDLVPAKAL